MGIQIPITDDPTKVDGTFISLGNTALAAQNGVSVAGDLNDDGFTITTKGSGVYVVAENNYGVLNGVLHFSEKYLGFEYLTKDYTKYGTVWSLSVNDVQTETCVPDFSMREYYARQSMTDKTHSANLRFETMQSTAFDSKTNGEKVLFGGAHELQDEIPREDYPSFYIRNGQTSEYKLDLTNGFTISSSSCTYDRSNANSLVSVVIAKVKAAITADTSGKGKYVMLGLPDSGFVPASNDTSAIQSAVGGYTGLYFTFVNTVASEVRSWMAAQGVTREIRFVGVAYWKTVYAAQCKPNLGSGVDLMLPQMFCQYHAITDSSCSSCADALATFNAWKAKLSADSVIWTWNYATNFTHSLFWFDNFAALGTNLQFYKENGVGRILYQGHPHAYNYYQGNLENYLFSKLLWDCSLDVSALIKQYNASYYGDSASVADSVVESMNASAGDNFYLWIYENESNVKNAYSLETLNANLDSIEAEITRISNSNKSQAVKTQRILRLKELEVQLRYMVLVNIEAYCGEGYSGTKAYAQDVYGLCQELGIEYFGEGISVLDVMTNTYKIFE